MNKNKTNTELFFAALQAVKAAGLYAESEQIIESRNTASFPTGLTDYHFGFGCRIEFGSIEGVFLDCYIYGHYDLNAPYNEKKELFCGSFKALDTSLETLQILGKLGAALTYYAKQYIEQNIEKFSLRFLEQK